MDRAQVIMRGGLWRSDLPIMYAMKPGAIKAEYVFEPPSGISETLPNDAGEEAIDDWARSRARACEAVAMSPLPADLIRSKLAAIVERFDIEPPVDRVRDGPAIARMCDVAWWRRQARRSVARAYEDNAIKAGEVSHQVALYVSQHSLKRVIEQARRNRAALDAQLMVSEDGQVFSLGELADKGTGNPALRRGELMTRINGFEVLARGMGWVAEFITITCPSRMHARLYKGGGNPRYDGTTPRDAQAYLNGVLAKVRAQLAKKGIQWFGVLIAEPQHDATPHHHILVFVHPQAVAQVRELVARYALADSPDERGAAEHRVTFEAIDPTRGSAAGYVVKYVAKNIDGEGVEADLFGEPGKASALRARAWASTWGIRQFRQLGGVPVGLWREFRKIPEAIAMKSPCEKVREAWRCAQRIEQEGGQVKAADFAGFVRVLGGPVMARAKRLVKLWQVWRDEPGRYGEPIGFKPAGVQSAVIVRDGIVKRSKLVLVESLRRVWHRVAQCVAARVRGFSPGGREAPRGAWTRVNNCNPEYLSSAGNSSSAFAGRGGGRSWLDGLIAQKEGMTA
jgi:hypothetical protein